VVTIANKSFSIYLKRVIGFGRKSYILICLNVSKMKKGLGFILIALIGISIVYFTDVYNKNKTDDNGLQENGINDISGNFAIDDDWFDNRILGIKLNWLFVLTTVLLGGLCIRYYVYLNG